MVPINLIISLGTSIFVSLMVFLYFRNRMKSLEFKLNTMFQLIQDHVSKQKTEEKELIQVSDVEEYEGGGSSAETVTTEEPINNTATVEVLEPPLLKMVEKEESSDEESAEESEHKDETDYTRLSVAALKKIAEERNLEKYKSLRKDALIELIKSSE